MNVEGMRTADRVKFVTLAHASMLVLYLSVPHMLLVKQLCMTPFALAFLVTQETEKLHAPLVRRF